VPRRIRPGRLRRRLAIAFVLVAGISAGALALGSYLLVRQSRLEESLDRAGDVARFDLGLAGRQFLPLDEEHINGLIAGFQDSGQPVVLMTGSNRIVSESTFELLTLSGPLQSTVRSGQIGYERVKYADHRLLIVGGRIPSSTDELYLLFNEDRIDRDLTQLRNVLLIGWGVVLVLGGLVGSQLARRTLGPVAKASQAARSMAEGLLATRLPVEGQDEFGAWATSFNEMADALEAKIAALSEAQARERRFTSDVAHELRTPLTALVAEASLLREHLSRMPEESRRPAELLIQDVNRLRKLVDELMEISRFDAGRESVQAEPVDVEALIGAILRARGWDGRVRVESDGAILSTDRRRLERIVANLVGNAVEHAGAEVRVRVGSGGKRAYIEVVDSGPGVASEHLPHLFERFYKADPARSRGGSGLGLAIAMENARLLGGDIEVRSELGVGTAFRLVLPVTEPLHPGEGGVAPPADHEVQ
jgi:two-component system, OmpR family, sensor histidine kinase MtrB